MNDQQIKDADPRETLEGMRQKLISESVLLASQLAMKRVQIKAIEDVLRDEKAARKALEER